MDQLSRDFASGLFDREGGPFLSLYQPTHRSASGRQQDAIRFKNLVGQLEDSLRQRHSEREISLWIEPFRALADDSAFWRGALRDGLAVFGAPGVFRVYLLQRPMPELAMVAESFHIKPLIRTLQSADNFHVLAIESTQVRLFEGNRYHIDEVELPEDFPRTSEDVLGEQENKRFIEAWAPQAQQPGIVHGGGGEKDVATLALERFFRAVDEAVIEQFSGPSRQSLLLVGLPENLAVFRRVSRNSRLLESAIEANPASLSSEQLLEQSWRIVEPLYLERLTRHIDRFKSAFPHGKADSDVATIARRAVQGRVDTLLVDADRKVPGRLDPGTGAIERDEISNPEIDDLLDDIAQLVLRSGREVVLVPSDRMPTETGLAAIHRY